MADFSGLFSKPKASGKKPRFGQVAKKSRDSDTEQDSEHTPGQKAEKNKRRAERRNGGQPKVIEKDPEKNTEKNRRKKQRKRARDAVLLQGAAPAAPVAAERQGRPAQKQTGQRQAAERLEGGQFRNINEQLYTTTSAEAVRLFAREPELYTLYH